MISRGTKEKTGTKLAPLHGRYNASGTRASWATEAGSDRATTENTIAHGGEEEIHSQGGEEKQASAREVTTERAQRENRERHSSPSFARFLSRKQGRAGDEKIFTRIKWF